MSQRCGIGIEDRRSAKRPRGVQRKCRGTRPADIDQHRVEAVKIGQGQRLGAAWVRLS